MVDPDASTRTEVPLDDSGSESSDHEADGFAGPYSPRTGDSDSEDELDYKFPGQDIELKLYLEEYEETAKGHAAQRIRL